MTPAVNSRQDMGENKISMVKGKNDKKTKRKKAGGQAQGL